MTTTNNDRSATPTVAELFQAAGLVTEKSTARRPAPRLRWRTPSIAVALAAALVTMVLAWH